MSALDRYNPATAHLRLWELPRLLPKTTITLAVLGLHLAGSIMVNTDDMWFGFAFMWVIVLGILGIYEVFQKEWKDIEDRRCGIIEGRATRFRKLPRVLAEPNGEYVKVHSWEPPHPNASRLYRNPSYRVNSFHAETEVEKAHAFITSLTEKASGPEHSTEAVVLAKRLNR